MADTIVKANTPDNTPLDNEKDLLDSLNDSTTYESDTRDPEEIEARAKIEELMKLSPKEREAKVAIALERGIIHDRLTIPGVPADLHYEWVRNTPEEVNRMRGLGFWIDNNYSNKRALHSDGTSANVVGDTIAMMTTRENKRLIDKVRQESTINAVRKPQELREFRTATDRDSGGEIPTFTEGDTRQVGYEDVKAALAKSDAQTRQG